MKKAIVIIALAFAVVALMGCPAVNLPTLVNGSNAIGSKVGQASGMIILGIIGDVDAGAITAAKNGGITKVGAVDCRTQSLLGLAVKYTTTVSGE